MAENIWDISLISRNIRNGLNEYKLGEVAVASTDVRIKGDTSNSQVVHVYVIPDTKGLDGKSANSKFTPSCKESDVLSGNTEGAFSETYKFEGMMAQKKFNMTCSIALSYIDGCGTLNILAKGLTVVADTSPAVDWLAVNTSGAHPVSFSVVCNRGGVSPY
jgi:hypothetical protein